MKKSTDEIRALITLLGDEDGGIRDVARERLFEFGAEAEDYLREATHSDVEGKVRIEARHVWEKIRQEDVLGSFYLLGLRDDEEIDLEHAAFLLARFGYGDVDVLAHQNELDDLAHRARRRLADLAPNPGGRVIVETINQILFKEEGFRGNTKSYYDADNTYLNRVLERRTGIPITLSLVYLLIARRLRLPIRGINMPSHFICQFHTAYESFYFDPFNNGRLITRAECALVLQKSGHTLDADSLRPATTRTMLARMIRNLVLIYEHQEQHEKSLRLDRILKMLRTHG